MAYIKKFMAARLNDPIETNLLNKMLNSIEEEFKSISKGISSHASRHEKGGGDLISTLANLTVDKLTGNPLHLNYGANADAEFFAGSTTGENRYVYIKGYHTGVGVKWVRIGTLNSGRSVFDVEYMGLLQQGGSSIARWTNQYFRMYDDKALIFGSDHDYSAGYHSATDSLQIVDGYTLNSNILMKFKVDAVTLGKSGGKLGFYGLATPIALQTGVPVTAAGVHAALVNLGLITA